MSDKKTRLIVMSSWGNDRVFGDLFDSVFQHGRNGRNALDMVLGPEDVIVFEGGTDINSLFYEQRPSRWAQPPDRKRDSLEFRVARRGIEAGAGFLGICRGAQLLTAAAGGELIQHVSNHTNGAHNMIMADGEVIKTNSFHHQMMFPFNLDKESYKLLAHVPTRLSNDFVVTDENGKDMDIEKFLPENFVEPEMVWYPKIKALAIQGHPEFVATSGYYNLIKEHYLRPFVEYSRNYVKEYLLHDISL